MTAALPLVAGWRVRLGAPVYRPFIGLEIQPLVNGLLLRVSFWPDCTGFYICAWKERMALSERRDGDTP